MVPTVRIYKFSQFHTTCNKYNIIFFNFNLQIDKTILAYKKKITSRYIINGTNAVVPDEGFYVCFNLCVFVEA